jgi:Mn2+/Fe2+ NRAMP family transporter
MADDTAHHPGGGGSALATELPSKWLPGVPYRDLPDAVPIWKIIGASAIISATAMGSGEFIIWPLIVSQVGFTIFWAAILAFFFQYIMNMEIERYALVTGETAVTGFARLWRHWGIFFIICAILPNMWAGWATGASTTITFWAGLGSGAVVPITIIILVSIGIALSVSPVVYQTVEKIQMAMIVMIVGFVVVAVVVATDVGAWGALARGSTVEIGQNIPAAVGVVGAAAMAGAIAFAGAGGANNLVQANWVRDKEMGMGAFIPNIVSPITGEEEATPGTGYMTRPTEENFNRFRAWWKVANTEHFITFFVLGLLVTMVLCALTFATIGVDPGREFEEFQFIEQEGQALAQQVAPWFGTLFFIAGTIILFSTNLGVLDWVSRLVSDALKTDYMEESETFTMSRLYFMVLWAMIIFGSIVVAGLISAPTTLLIISASLSAVVMVFYNALLIVINRRFLPDPMKLGGWRLGAMILSFLFFLFFAGWFVVAEVGSIFGFGG